jgi:hypothetical integral membrane protein (TIGR02206 family)
MALFSPEHLAAIAVTVLVAVLLTATARLREGGVSNRHGQRIPLRHTPSATTLARGLAIVILAGFVAENATYVARGEWTARVNLPLQLSDAVTLVAIAALWRPRAGLLTELLWFWALSASLQAVLTPDLGDTFPDVLYFTFFATHAGAIAAACLLVVGLRLAPRPRGALRALRWTVALAAVAAIACVATGGNYMFLRRKPANASILDALGPWPWYIAGAAILALAILLVLEALARVATRAPASPSAAAPAGRR